MENRLHAPRIDTSLAMLCQRAYALSLQHGYDDVSIAAQLRLTQDQLETAVRIGRTLTHYYPSMVANHE